MNVLDTLKKEYEGFMSSVKDSNVITEFGSDLKQKIGEKLMSEFRSFSERVYNKETEVINSGLGLLKKQNQFTIENKSQENNKIEKSDISLLKKAIGLNETSIIKGENKKYLSQQFSGKKEIGKAIGKYRVTEAELKTYSERYLGKKVNSEEFRKSPLLQERYIENKIKYLRSRGYNDDEIFAIHYGGLNYDINRKSVKDYIEKGKKHLNFLTKKQNKI